MIDIVFLSHEKDLDTLDLAIEFAKENIENVDKVYVISNKKLTDKGIWIAEDNLEFTLLDVMDLIGKHQKTSWYYQQIIKLTIFNHITNLKNNVLICDSDTLFLNKVKMVCEETGDIFLSYSDEASKNTFDGYTEFMSKIIPGLTMQTNYSGVAHHIMSNKFVMKEIIDKVEALNNKKFWESCCDVINSKYKSVPQPINQPHPGKMSEYLFLFNYYIKFHKDKFKLRPLNQIMAYKEYLGVEGYIHENRGSRLNLKGRNVRILSDNEKNFKFKNIECAFRHIANIAKNKGYDSITFQKHTRIGHQKYTKKSLEYLENIKK